MTDREKTIKGLKLCAIGSECVGRECPYWHNVLNGEIKLCDCTTELVRDALTLLQEQRDDIKILTSDLEGLQKEHEKLLDKKIPLLTNGQEIVRCKDCKHRGNSEKCVLAAISEEKDYPLFMLDNRGEWFCADGERW